MSISHRDPSTLTQVTLTIDTTIASAADTWPLNSSAFRSFFETNLLSIKPFVSTETTDTKVEATSFGTCVISQKTSLQEDIRKAEQMHMEKNSGLDLFSIPSDYHASTLESPTANLNNVKMHTNQDADNSNEKDIDTLDALVKEKTTSSILATTQRLFC